MDVEVFGGVEHLYGANEKEKKDKKEKKERKEKKDKMK